MDKSKGNKRRGRRVAHKHDKVEDKLLSFPIRDTEPGVSALLPPGPFGYQGPSTSGLTEINILRSNLLGLFEIQQQQQSASSDEWKFRVDRRLWKDVLAETIKKGEIDNFIPEIAGDLEKTCFDGSTAEDEYIGKINQLCNEIQSMGLTKSFQLIKDTKVVVTPEGCQELPTFIVPGSPYSYTPTQDGGMMRIPIGQETATANVNGNSPGLVLNQNEVEQIVNMSKDGCAPTEVNSPSNAGSEEKSPQYKRIKSGDEEGNQAC